MSEMGDEMRYRRQNATLSPNGSFYRHGSRYRWAYPAFVWEVRNGWWNEIPVTKV